MIWVIKRKHTRRWQAVMTAGLLLASSAPHAELAGRVFFSPQERAALDSLRHNIAAPGVRAASGPITVNGLVSSSRGANTVWINGAPQHEGEQITAPGEISITLPDSTRRHPLKVGQTLTPGNGEIREGYQSGAAPDGPNKVKE